MESSFLNSKLTLSLCGRHQPFIPHQKYKPPRSYILLQAFNLSLFLCKNLNLAPETPIEWTYSSLWNLQHQSLNTDLFVCFNFDQKWEKSQASSWVLLEHSSYRWHPLSPLSSVTKLSWATSASLSVRIRTLLKY